MAHPIGLLLPWLVFAIAVGLKTWNTYRMINRQVRNSPWGMERFRAALERNWLRSESLR
jgi:hypothetical protein